MKQELRSATGLALRVTEVTAQSLGKAMSTLVVQERHRWLSLAERSDIYKACFLDALISQAGLFDDTGFATPEPGPAQAPVQDVDTQVRDQMHTAPGLVCSNRPEGSLHSCFDPSTTQTVPTVCV